MVRNRKATKVARKNLRANGITGRAHELVHALQDQHFDLHALTRRELVRGRFVVAWLMVARFLSV